MFHFMGSSYPSMFAPILHALEAQWDVQETAICAIELQQTHGSAQRLVLLKTGLNDTHPNHELFNITYVGENLYKLAGESGSQVARAHSCLTGRLAQTLLNFGYASGSFRISSSPPKWRIVP